MSGLPGVGKSTLAQALANRVAGVYLRIDDIEQALFDAGQTEVSVEGYMVAYRVAESNLRLGRNVIADSCNTIAVTRDAWHRVAEAAAVRFVDIEVVCSDVAEHRRRVEERTSEVQGLRLPTWAEVEDRYYEKWASERVVIDTARRPRHEVIPELLAKVLRESPSNSATCP
jgi:predicted kinase